MKMKGPIFRYCCIAVACTLLIPISIYIKHTKLHRETSLLQTLEIGEKIALAWNRDAKPMMCSSTDSKTQPSNAGANGKREFWNALYGIPGSNKGLLIQIGDGQVQY